MKNIFIYSSVTGNTKKLAEAVHNSIDKDCEFYRIQEIPEGLENENAIFFLFYWNDKGTADLKSTQFMKKLKNKNVIAMGTLGAYADGEHAQKMLNRVRNLLEGNGNHLLSEFCSRGKIEVSRTIRRLELPEGDPHRLDREGTIRHLTSHFHPNEEDFKNAISAAISGLSKLNID